MAEQGAELLGRCCGVELHGRARDAASLTPSGPGWQRQLPAIRPLRSQHLPCAPRVFHVSFLSLFRLIAFQLLEEMQEPDMFNFNLGNRLGSSLVSSLLSIRFSQG